jgi:ribosome assembly protein RRB1
MSKRQADQDDLPQTKSTLGGQQRHPQAVDTNGMGEFEDAWEDEIEEESEVEDMDQDNGDGKTREKWLHPCYSNP